MLANDRLSTRRACLQLSGLLTMSLFKLCLLVCETRMDYLILASQETKN